MTPRALAEAVLAVLPEGGGRVAVLGRDVAGWGAALGAGGWSVAIDGPVAAAVVSFLGEPGDPAARGAVLRQAADRLAVDGTLVVVDHSRPRGPIGRVAALPGLWIHRLGAARAAYPTAREIAARGFVVERLRLAARERVQVVAARPRQATPLRTT